MGWIASFLEWINPKPVEVAPEQRLSLKYFSDIEIRCKKTHGIRLDPIFDRLLAKLRENVGEPMVVTSCCRSKVHNTNVGGSKGSFHVYDFPYHDTAGTCAIDIRRKGSTYDFKLILEAWELGFSVGVHPSFFHFDCRTAVTGKPQIVFAYAGRTNPVELKKFKKLVGIG